MMAGTDQRGLTRYALLTAGATLVLICIGGMVTSRGAGMAVPDWPNTYGYNMFLFPVSQWVGGILYEHTHRLMGALVGLLTAGLAVWLWVRETQGRPRQAGVVVMLAAVGLLGVRAMPVYVALAVAAVPIMVWGLYRFAQDTLALRWLGVTALAAVILQGVLGGLRVAWMKDEIGVFHGMLAQSFFVLIGLITLFTTCWWRESRPGAETVRVRGVLLLGTILVFAQLGLGAAMRHRHAGLAVPDFPLAHGRIWPRTDAEALQRYNQQRMEVVAAHPIARADVVLHMAHRLGALLVLGAGLLAWRAVRRHLPQGHAVRRATGLWLGLILVQFTLGAITVWTNKAADIATAHVAVGSLILLTGGILCATTWMGSRRAVQASGAPVGASRGFADRLTPAAT